MTQKLTRQSQLQKEFCKAKVRLFFTPFVALAVVGTLTLWLRTNCEDSWQRSLRAYKRAKNGNCNTDNGTGNHIWFLETSSRRTLSAREACSIESACVHNLHYTVHLLSTGNITDADCPYHRVLSTLGNFRSESLNATSELAATPLAALHAEGALLGGPYYTAHLSDFLRYAVLWKRGGVYLDTDVIVFKSLNGITNSAVYQDDDGVVANGILFFDRQHPVLEALMTMCADNYNPYVWAACGPAIMSLLPTHVVLREYVNFLDKTTFLAVPYQEWESLFESNRTQWVMGITNSSYGSHFWNNLSKERSVTPGSGCAVDVMAKAHCPRVYKLASTQSYL
ncbi:lactosylceramide 4-alpha-galactosyltransferase-like [Amblyomma americanum]